MTTRLMLSMLSLCYVHPWVWTEAFGTWRLAIGLSDPVGRAVGSLWTGLASSPCHQKPFDWYLRRHHWFFVVFFEILSMFLQITLFSCWGRQDNMTKWYLCECQDASFPAEHCIVTTYAVLHVVPVSGFDVVADWCMFVIQLTSQNTLSLKD